MSNQTLPFKNYKPESAQDSRRRKKIIAILLIFFALIFSLFLIVKYIERKGDVKDANTDQLTTISVVDTQDTFVRKSAPSSNFGNATLLETTRLFVDTDKEYEITYLHFDLRDVTLPQLAGKTAECNGCSIKLKFQIQKPFAQDGLNFTIAYQKIIKAMPFTNWSEDTFDFNKAIYIDPKNNEKVNDAMDHYRYPAIAMFIPKTTGGDQALQAKYRANVYNVSGSSESIVEVDLTEDLKDLMGTQFTLVVEDISSPSYEDFRIYSKESTGKTKPQLVITYKDKPAPTPFNEAVKLNTAPLSNNNVPSLNPYSGLHKWRGATQVPLFDNTADVYERYYWNQVEPTQGNYKFDLLKNQIAALKPGQKFSFRIRMMQKGGHELPGYLSQYTKPCEGSNVPDWMNSTIISRGRALAQALAAEFDGHPKVGWVDLGMLGRFGEWGEGCTEDTLEEAKTYVHMFTDYFKKTQLVLRNGHPYGLTYASTLPPNANGFYIGSRSDTYGDSRFNATYTTLYRNYTKWKVYKDLWKRAPVLGESQVLTNPIYLEQAKLEATALHVATVGNGNTHFDYDDIGSVNQQRFRDWGLTMGSKLKLNSLTFDESLKIGDTLRVKTSWSNLGNVPVYENWQVKLKFTKLLSQTFTTTLNVDPKDIIPTTNIVSNIDEPVELVQSITIPSNITDGTYKVTLSIEQENRKNLKLFIQDSDALDKNAPSISDGIYSLGTVQIEDGPATTDATDSAVDGAVTDSGTEADGDTSTDAADGGVEDGSDDIAVTECEFGFIWNGTKCVKDTGGSQCGNGIRNPFETCDDGNKKNGDGCSSLCQIEFNKTSVTCGPADVDGDNKFTIIDIAAFVKTIGIGTEVGTNNKKYCEYKVYTGCGGVDTNNDGRVDLVDVASFVKRIAGSSSKSCNL